jgi:hypothetical protein
VLGTIGGHALRAGRSLHGSSLLDRLLRGRGWIGLLGFLLIGLVAVNVSLLKLNAQAGRNAEEARKLRIANADLRGRVIRLGSAERIQKAATKLGFVEVQPGSIRYLSSRGEVDGRLAVRRLELGATSDTTGIVPTSAAVAPLDVTPAETPDSMAPADPATPPEQPAPGPVPAVETPATPAPATGGGAAPPTTQATPGAG